MADDKKDKDKKEKPRWSAWSVGRKPRRSALNTLLKQNENYDVNERQSDQTKAFAKDPAATKRVTERNRALARASGVNYGAFQATAQKALAGDAAQKKILDRRTKRAEKRVWDWSDNKRVFGAGVPDRPGRKRVERENKEWQATKAKAGTGGKGLRPGSAAKKEQVLRDSGPQGWKSYQQRQKSQPSTQTASATSRSVERLPSGDIRINGKRYRRRSL